MGAQTLTAQYAPLTASEVEAVEREARAASELEPERFDDIGGDLVLDGEDVLELAVVPSGPDLEISEPQLARGAVRHYNRVVSFDDAIQLLAALEREKVAYVLIGSMAMAAQGVVRATRDVDFFVSPSPDNVDRLRRALKSVFDNDPNVDEITAEDLAGSYPAIEYTPPHARFSVDILARLGEIWRYEDLEFEILIIDGVSVRVATPVQIYRMKKDTVRPQDRLDAETMRQHFDISED